VPYILALYPKQFLELKLTYDYHENTSQRAVDWLPMLDQRFILHRSSPLIVVTRIFHFSFVVVIYD